jgi:hypothetical protein
MTILDQAALDQACELRFVLDDECAHAGIVPLSARLLLTEDLVVSQSVPTAQRLLPPRRGSSSRF